MKKIKTQAYCDICDKECEDINFLDYLENLKLLAYYNYGGNKSIHVCNSCGDKIIKFYKVMMK